MALDKTICDGTPCTGMCTRRTEKTNGNNAERTILIIRQSTKRFEQYVRKLHYLIFTGTMNRQGPMKSSEGIPVSVEVVNINQK